MMATDDVSHGDEGPSVVTAWKRDVMLAARIALEKSDAMIGTTAVLI
jgi:hypothetical protein